MLILQFRGRAVETGDELVEIEDALVELLEADEALDGHEVTPSARSISVATADAHAAFARIAPFLARARLLHEVVAAVREGDRCTVLWPQGAPAFPRT
jgi:hypothetical protein